MPEPHSEASRLLGERLRALRLKTACSQEEIANLAGMNVSNYGKMERGSGNPEFLTLIRLASVLGADAAELVSGIGGETLPEKRRVFTAREFVSERNARRSPRADS
ncbi:MAG TPA: helix-turn-helix transcriptional regulator [Galbitalea sp.]|jgi:transcriptional regulator with XRE-family HTH domain|nr:helix-turn-helix transcriptional regulator [Galbitalea sp.]